MADFFYKKDGKNNLKKRSFLVEQAVSFFPIFLLVLIFRSFLFEPFRIPSSSMMPTLLIGDFILVNKYEYGLRLPVLYNKFIDINDPKRGDVVVFRYPDNPKICLLYTSPSPRDGLLSRMPSSA